MVNPTLTLKVDGTYRLRRLCDCEYQNMWISSIAIEEISFFFEDYLSELPT